MLSCVIQGQCMVIKNIPLPPLQRLVVKPDQLIKRRGKLGLVGIDLDLDGVQEWVRQRLMRETTVSRWTFSHLFIIQYCSVIVEREVLLGIALHILLCSGTQTMILVTSVDFPSLVHIMS